MKIAFALMNEKELAVDFAHSHYLGIYDEEKDKTEVIPLAGIDQKSGVTALFHTMTNEGLSSVVSTYYSYLTIRVFKENNIETLKAIGTNLEENINRFKSGQLKPFELYESLLIGECAKDCAGCGSSCSD